MSFQEGHIRTPQFGTWQFTEMARLIRQGTYSDFGLLTLQTYQEKISSQCTPPARRPEM
jgi:hypothetical protein